MKTTILYLQNEKPEVVIDLPTNGRPTGKNALPFDWEHRVSIWVIEIFFKKVLKVCLITLDWKFF